MQPRTGALRATLRSSLIFFLALGSLDAISSDLSAVPRARPVHVQGLDRPADALSGGDLLAERRPPAQIAVSFGQMGSQVALL